MTILRVSPSVQANIAKSIMACRKNARLSQKDVASRVGVTACSVANWEAMRNTPFEENLTDLASLFGVTVRSIMSGSAAAKKTASAKKPDHVPDHVPDPEPDAKPEEAPAAVRETLHDMAKRWLRKYPIDTLDAFEIVSALASDSGWETVQKVEKWAAENPAKTYRDDFAEKFPDAVKDHNGFPCVGLSGLYPISDSKRREFYSCFASPFHWLKPLGYWEGE